MKLRFYGPQKQDIPLSECRRLWQALPDSYEGVLGWLDCLEATEGYVQAVKEKAAEWREYADTLVVVGVGGSNQAARGVIDALGTQGGLDIVWAGNTLSAWELQRILEKLEGRSVVMHVIAKNFETLEPGSHYRVLRSWMEKRYDEKEMARRVVLTGTEGSACMRWLRSAGIFSCPSRGPSAGATPPLPWWGFCPSPRPGWMWTPISKADLRCSGW